MMKKFSSIVAFVLFSALLCLGQLGFQPPIVTAGATTAITWTGGTVNNGGHPVTVASGSSTVSLNKTDCTSPVFASCNFVIVNSSGTVSVTATLATAQANGNSLIAFIETGAATTTQIVYPWQSGTLWLGSLGPLTAFAAAPTPSSAAGAALGSNALPWSSLFIGTAATNNINIVPLATSAARTINLADQGATAAVAFADPSVTTKVIAFDISGMTAAKTITIASNSANSRTVTITDPGGNANFAWANPTTAQALTNLSSIASSTTNPASTGIVKLGNTDFINWRNAANGADIGLSVNASNFLVYNGTAPTDGSYFVGPENCSMALTTGTFAANPATSGALSAPSLVRAASGNTVLQLTTTAAANTTDAVCDFTPPTRLTSGKGITITGLQVLFGYGTTALTSIGTLATNKITYPASAGAAAGTVASIGGVLTVNPGTSHSTPGATTTSGQCYSENISFGTPYAHVTDLVRLNWQNTFLQSAASATIMQICGTIVYYSNINSL